MWARLLINNGLEPISITTYIMYGLIIMVAVCHLGYFPRHSPMLCTLIDTILLIVWALIRSWRACRSIDVGGWLEKTVVKNGFASYGFPTGDVYGLNESTKKAKKCVRALDGIHRTVALTAVLVTIHAVVSRADLAANWKAYDEYRKRSGDRGEMEHVRASGCF